MRGNDYQPCSECGELEAHALHHETVIAVSGHSIPADFHMDICNYDASWEGEERGYVATMDCHEWEPGCYCGERGKCEVCVEQAVSQAEYLRDVAREG